MLAGLAHTLRTLGRNPAFAATAVITIALGIGLNTAVFTVIRAVLLGPLPYRDPERLVYLWESNPQFPTMAVAAPDYRDWTQSTQAFTAIAAYTVPTMNQGILLGEGAPAQVQAVMASHQLLPMLGVSPLLGRLYTAGEERTKAPVALLSERLWRSLFHADPAIIGRTVRLEQTAFTVVGILPARAAFPSWADFWMPLSFLEPQLENSRKFHPLEVVARLRPETSPTAAAHQLRAIMEGLAARFPATNGSESAVIVPMLAHIVSPVRGALLAVWAAVAVVLLIVSVNIAHLVLARSAAREKELAIRAALGASQWHLIRTLTAENLLLTLAGSTAGILLAWISTPLLARLAAGAVPRAGDIAFDSSVALFGVAAALASAVLFLAPALWNARRPALRQAMTPPHRRFGRSLVAAEIALAFVVLAGAALLVRSFTRLIQTDPGLDARNLLVMEVSLPRPNYDWDRSRRWFDQQLAPALRQLPGVEVVATGNVTPLTLPGADQIHRFATRFGLPGQSYPEGRYPIAQVRWGTEDYFRTLGVRLVRGRFLEEQDRAKPHYLINETLAARYFPGQDPIGKQLIFGVTDPKQNPVDIIGVVSDVRDLNLELAPEPTIYSSAMSMGFTLFVRHSGNVTTDQVLALVRAAEPESAVRRAGSMQSLLDAALDRRRLSLNLLAAFAALALLLAAIGIYGVVSYATATRVKEFGLRMALGAAPTHVRTIVLRETALLAAAGLAAGLALSITLAPLARPLLYHVAPYDAASLTAAAAFLFLAGLASAWLPARNAARLDPATALRRE